MNQLTTQAQVSRSSGTSWTDELIAADLRQAAQMIGSFPSASELRRLGRNDLCCAIVRCGGFASWASRIGMERKGSDSDTGWEGERVMRDIFTAMGYRCEKATAVKSPFDLLVDDVLRVDVKSARFKEYGPSKGWFFRIGKIPQADLVVLLKLDTQAFYAVPWWDCPTSNITITPTGDRYTQYLNGWHVVKDMVQQAKEMRTKYPKS